MLKQYPFVEIRTYHTEKFSEQEKINKLTGGFWDLYTEHVKKNGGFIKGKTEMAWCTLTDFDEVIYYPVYDYLIFKTYLERTAWAGYNVFNEPILNLVSNFPPLDTDEFAHLQVDMCSYGDGFDWRKPLLFRMDNIYKLNVYPGQHWIHFKYFDAPVKAVHGTRHLHVFHLKYLLGVEWLGIRRKNMEKVGFWGTEDSIITNHVNTFNRYLKNSISIKDYLSYKMLNGIVPGEDGELSSVREIF